MPSWNRRGHPNISQLLKEVNNKGQPALLLFLDGQDSPAIMGSWDGRKRHTYFSNECLSLSFFFHFYKDPVSRRAFQGCLFPYLFI